MPAKTGIGEVTTSEGFYLRGPNAAFWDRMRPVPALIYAHGASQSAKSVSGNPVEIQLIQELSKKFLVLVGDWGGSTFGYTPSNTRLTSGFNKLQSYNVIPGKIGLVGASMGNAVNMTWAKSNLTKVAFIAGLIPLTDITRLLVDRPDIKPQVDAAFGGTYSSTTHGPNYSPIQYVSSLGTSFPISLFYGFNDHTVDNATTEAFQAARPETHIMGYDSGVGEGHTFETIQAAQSDIVDFCFANAPK